RSLLGGEQERWLLNGFDESHAYWDVLGQQVVFSQLDLVPGTDSGFNPDAWDGYPGDRDRVIAGIVNSPVRNALVLTGDVHSHWAAEVHEDADDLSSAVVAAELVTTSITSGGDGSDTRSEVEAVLPENPHVRFYNNRRGYVRTQITPGEVRADFRVVPYVSRPGAEVRTAASFTVADRDEAVLST
ncbi:MAG: alkaline phosphatase, partial [Mycobacterium sp.]|nr:alkaline phosphatase [Mycobacterium sp.]